MADEIWILENEPIRVSFDTMGYTFYKGGRGILGSPTEAYLRLIAVKGAEKVELPRVADLKRRVVIKTPEESLEFVRLFSSIETHYLFPEFPYLEPREAHDTPGAGEYTQQYKRRMNLEPPSSKEEDNVFVIEENLVDRTGKLFRGTERVGRDGDYALLKTVLIDEHSPVIYPLYE